MEDKTAITFGDDRVMIAWDVSPRTPRVVVVPWPDDTRRSDQYKLTTGYCNIFFRDLSESQQAQALLNLAAQLMFNGVPPHDILQEFAKIRIWREMGVILPSGDFPRAFIRDNIKFNPHNP